jgi:hypothetical protein
MRRKAILFALVGVCVGQTARADIPVTDAPRETTEKSISDCMTKARVYKQQTQQPSQGIQQSVNTPGPSGVPSAGSAVVSGTGVTAPAGGQVSGVDFSQVPMVAPGGGQSAGAINLNTVAQTVASLGAVPNALSSNNSNTQAASAMMGVLALTQSAWNQNSTARTNNGALWNQVIQLATVTAQLINQRGVNMTSGASLLSMGLTFSANAATFIGAQQSADTNAVVVVASPTK